MNGVTILLFEAPNVILPMISALFYCRKQRDLSMTETHNRPLSKQLISFGRATNEGMLSVQCCQPIRLCRAACTTGSWFSDALMQYWHFQLAYSCLLRISSPYRTRFTQAGEKSTPVSQLFLPPVLVNGVRIQCLRSVSNGTCGSTHL